ncbi:MAG: aconitase family protein, partial [Terriglobia bacterium]
MGMTISEKILASHVGKDEVSPGEFILLRPDLVLANDITAPLAISEFREIEGAKVFDRDRVVFVPDHFTPNKDVQAARQAQAVRRFVKEEQLTNYWEVGRGGIEHVLLPDEGLVLPGQVVVGADSHTCTYGALGAFATGVGSTDVAYAMATGEVWLRVPAAQLFSVSGKLNRWVGGKDLILFILGRIGVDGALYKSMEFAGPGLKELTQDDRFSLANMAIEGGAKN